MIQVLFATSNKHKVFEANAVGKEYGVRFKQVNVTYPEIRSESVSEVAKAGALHVYSQIKKPVIVEDSGLFIKALNGFPGAYSRFVFDKIGCDGTIRLMSGIQERNASFISAIGYKDKDDLKVFEGTVEGKMMAEKKGGKGFGYDPLFTPTGFLKTFAEDPESKNTVSHRKKAVEKLCDYLKSDGHKL